MTPEQRKLSKADIKKIIEQRFKLNYKDWENEVINEAVYHLIVDDMLKTNDKNQQITKGGEL